MEDKKITPFNPKIGNGFSNDKFGKGSIKVDVDAAGLAAITQNLQVGGSILLKYNRVSSKGNLHYFCEILPPYNRVAPSRGKTTPVAKQKDYGDID